ncbi:conserved hypothetical protein [Paecilomyces variotii No. 5]|uniref:Uncharacterized protein n=1 Tax=Byssochlamys spectabilis (strain No. 5 / NBRC 109023) TaxID=1356009 RepID=V5FYD9_BYSSN|nr:conserved hypothetical protein [Paecilomyces variotii No. 5]
MPADRSAGRNVFIEFASAPGIIQGGLCAAKRLTQAQFLDMLDILFIAPGGFYAYIRGSSKPIWSTEQVLRRGYYILYTKIDGEKIHVSNQHFYPRVLSLENTGETDSFRDQVRRRDRRCVITHHEAVEADDDHWVGFEVAHILPKSRADIFHQEYMERLIDPKPGGVNSPQNGILLRADIHQLWDNYEISMKPDSGYRVQVFRPSGWYIHNKIMHICSRQANHQQRVLDLFLRWHFEQAVLCNMRGTGEPLWEHDFPPGSDMVGEILEGPVPAQRMEVELFKRLHGYDGAVSEEDSDKDEDGDRA